MILMLANSAAEVLSLAALLPFLTLLANPEGLWNKPLVQQWAPRVGISNADSLILPFTVMFIFTVLVAGVVRLLNLWLNGRLASAIGSDLSCEAYRRTLYQPYANHLASNSSDLIASISTDTPIVVSQIINPLLLSLSSGLTAVSIVITLIMINWKVFLAVVLIITLVYALAVIVSHASLKKIGERQVILNRSYIKILQEGLGAIRDVLLANQQIFYANTYKDVDLPLRRLQTDKAFLNAFPRQVIEPVGLALIATIGYFLFLERENAVTNALPILGALGLGAQRLLPMVQRIYEGWAQTHNAKESLVNVLQMLSYPLPSIGQFTQPNPLRFKQNIQFENVRFSYDSQLPEVLRGVTLQIRCGERVGLIGSTGSGKSTTLDILMGLLVPTSGRILIDGNNLHESGFSNYHLRAWQATIAHVPQTIYMADSSIAENIAFGLPYAEIDMAQVHRAAQLAQIASFIESQPHDYHTFVGERGIRLSGGQRQRIGIARALYKHAQVLIFDEATSALDTTTEMELNKAIESLSKDLTIITIAHRLSTIQKCDRVFRLEKGIVVFEGHPEDILDGR